MGADVSRALAGAQRADARERLCARELLQLLKATGADGVLLEKSDDAAVLVEAARPTTAAAQLAQLIPKGRDYVHPFLTDDWRACVANSAGESEVLFVMSPTTADHTADEMVESLLSVDHAGAAWLLEYDDTPEARASFSGIGKPFKLAGDDRLFCASFSVDHPNVEWLDKAAPAQLTELLKRRIPIHKTGEERFVLGIVLEPNNGEDGAPMDPDAQEDIYSAEDIRTAAHTFMEEFGNLGLMHKEFINGAAKILETYIAPVTFQVGAVKVRKGTWLLAIRVVDDALWLGVQSGELTGFSIGGSALRKPTS